MVDQIGRVGSIRGGLDLVPEFDEIASIRPQLDAALSLSRGADDPSTAAELVDHAFEPCAFVVVDDPSRDAELFHRWHINQKASG